MIHLSLDSQSDAACHKLLEEVDATHSHPDPLEELIAAEEEFDVDAACAIMNAIHPRRYRAARTR